MEELPQPKTITKEEVLTAYNIEHGSNYTFQELGRQLALKELSSYRHKMLISQVVKEVII